MFISWFSTASDNQLQPPSEATQRIKRSVDFMSSRDTVLAGEMIQDSPQE